MRNGNRKGQVIVLVTLALFAMCGLMGLAVDFSWSFFVEKEAQLAADAAAMAAVLQADERFNAKGLHECDITDTTVQCLGANTRYDCASAVKPIAHNLDAGCLYAVQNGFTDGSPRQKVQFEADGFQPGGAADGLVDVPTAPGVRAFYWARAIINQSVPQLFSAVLGNTEGIVSSDATAAIVWSESVGSLILLNREDDCLPLNNGGTNAAQRCGTNILVQANNNSSFDAITVAGGIVMSSTADGTGSTPDGEAHDFTGEAQGGSVVTADWMVINEGGALDTSNNADWNPDPVQTPDRDVFTDPTKDRRQPPTPSINATSWGAGTPQDRSVVDGQFLYGNASYVKGDGSGDSWANAIQLAPGVYYSREPDGSGGFVANGNRLRLDNSKYYEFAPDPSNPTFGEWVIVGGLEFAGGGGHLKIGPGRYIFAGVKENNGAAGQILNFDANPTVTDEGPVDGATPEDNRPNNAGEIIVFTDMKYPGLDTIFTTVDGQGQTASGRGLQALTQANTVRQGKSGFQAGNTGNVEINLHGLACLDCPAAGDVPSDLRDHRSFVMWQDRKNSVVDYSDDGPANNYSSTYTDADGNPQYGHIVDWADPANLVVNDRASYSANPDLNSSDQTGGSTEFTFRASPQTDIWGVVYQPRGAFASMQGGGLYSGPIQLVTGAVALQGNSNLNLGILSDPILDRIVTLVH